MTRNDKGGESCGYLDKSKSTEPLLPVYMDLSGLRRDLHALLVLLGRSGAGAGYTHVLPDAEVCAEPREGWRKKGGLDGPWRKHKTEARGRSNPGHCRSPLEGVWRAWGMPLGCLTGLQFTWEVWNAEKPWKATLGRSDCLSCVQQERNRLASSGVGEKSMVECAGSSVGNPTTASTGGKQAQK